VGADGSVVSSGGFQAIPMLDDARTLGSINVKDVIVGPSYGGCFDVNGRVLGPDHDSCELSCIRINQRRVGYFGRRLD
jgi:hypothetical protein